MYITEKTTEVKITTKPFNFRKFLPM